MKYIMFGAGENAVPVMLKLKYDFIEVEYIVDNDKEKLNKEVNGKKVVSPEYLKNENYDDIAVLISLRNDEVCTKIEKQLNDMGIKNVFSVGFLSLDYSFHFNSIPGKIDLEDGHKSMKSYDEASRLIISDKNFYRVVSKKYIEDYKEIYSRCKNNNLFGKYIVNTEEVKTSYSDYSLKHEFISPISYCYEWSYETFYDYVDFMIDFLYDLDKSGLGLHDCHTHNAVIYKGSFIFLDFGAITLGNTPKVGLYDFICTHIHPLILFKKNQKTKAYQMLKNPGIRWLFSDISGYLTDEEKSQLLDIRNIFLTEKSNYVIKVLDRLKVLVGGIKQTSIDTYWIDYQNDEWEKSKDKSLWTEKMINVDNMIREANPKTIIDLAGNMGWYSAHLYDEIEYSIVVDVDDSAINKLWEKVKISEMKNVYPLHMNCLAPTLPIYYGYEYISENFLKPWREGAIQRFKSDMALALAIVHHLVFRQVMDFEEIIYLLSRYTNKYLIVEFVDVHDKNIVYLEDYNKGGFDWYSKEEFEEELGKKFKILETMPSTPSDTRILYLCEKK